MKNGHRPDPAARVFVVAQGGEAAGLLIGVPDGNRLNVLLDYATPVYRDCSVGTALCAQLPSRGVRTLVCRSFPAAHAGYLERMGFSMNPDGSAVKHLDKTGG